MHQYRATQEERCIPWRLRPGDQHSLPRHTSTLGLSGVRHCDISPTGLNILSEPENAVVMVSRTYYIVPDIAFAQLDTMRERLRAGAATWTFPLQAEQQRNFFLSVQGIVI